MIFFEALASGGGSEWYYTVLMKAPLGAEITLDDNDEEVTATGAGTDTLIGIPVHNPSSAYELTVKMNGLTSPSQTVNTPVNSGAISDVITVNFANIHIVYDDNFRGQDLSITDGTHTASPAPKFPTTGNVMDIYVPYTGDWTLEATDPVSGDTFNSSPNPVPITSLTQSINVGLYVIPDGEKVTPTDDIETWLLCADIKDTGYTTLEEVLNDEEVLIKVLTDENATQYLKRSKTFINAGLVPIMTDNTHPSGQVIYSSSYSSYPAYQIFDGTSTPGSTNEGVGGYIGFDFGTPTKISKAKITSGNTGVYKVQAYINGSWEDVATLSPSVIHTDYEVEFDPVTAEKFRFLCESLSSGSRCGFDEAQFFPWKEGITENELAMQAIGSYDVAANILLSDSDWESALGSSDYGTDVFNTKVPKMTSNSAPSGAASCSSYYNNNDDFNAYKAFHLDPLTSNADTRGWLPAASQSNQWVQYDFGESKEVSVWALSTDYGSGDKTFTLTASNDSSFSSPVTLGTITAKADNYSTIHSPHVGDGTPYRYYRVTISGTTDNSAQGIRCQFYGREAGGIQDWIKAAGLTKPYTTLQEVLNDPNTLATLVTNHDAVDYLVTAKALIDDICADETAMRYIGKRNYCADTLLADEDWYVAIRDSVYFESVLNALVPAMTTETKANVGGTNELNSNYARWRAFDKNYNSSWQSNNTKPAKVFYKFPSAITIEKGFISPLVHPTNNYIYAKTYKVIASNDGNTWVDLTDTITYSGSIISGSPDRYGSNQYFNVTKNKGSYIYYGVNVLTSDNGNYCGIAELQIYGRSDVDESKIDVYAAAADTISRVKSDGTTEVVCTTDNDGYYQIDKSDLPNGEYLLESGVADLPIVTSATNQMTPGTGRLQGEISTDKYSQHFKVTNDTVELVFMPETLQNILYWYGYKGKDIEKVTTGNGWQSTNHSNHTLVDNTVYNQRDIQEYTSNASYYSGVGNKSQRYFEKVAHMISTLKSAASGVNDYSLILSTTKDLHSRTLQCSTQNAYKDKRLLSEIYDKGRSSQYDKSSYTVALGDGDGGINIHAYWINDENRLPTYLSAANDILYILDGARQVPIATTNAEGKSYALMLEPGTYDIYSSVAKDPSDLNQPYHKQVTITPYTRTVKVMPENTLYWWGYIDENLEDQTTANGWSNNGNNNTVNTKSLNYMQNTSQSSGNVCVGSGTKNAIKTGAFHSIVLGVTTTGSGGYGAVNIAINKTTAGIVSGANFTCDASNMAHDVFRSDIKDYFVNAFANNGRANKVFALWYEGPSIYSNFFSAANDTVYYTENGVDIVVAETNGVGEARVDFSQIPTGVTLKSTVADDPDSLATTPAKFSKVFNGPNADGKFYLMPEDGDKMLYWYGWMSDNCEAVTAENGWSSRNSSLDSPTFDESKARLSVSNNTTGCGIGTKSIIPSASKFKGIIQGITVSGTTYGYIVTTNPLNSKSYAESTPFSDYIMINTNTKDLWELDTSARSDFRCGAYLESNRTMDVYAFWYE